MTRSARAAGIALLTAASLASPLVLACGFHQPAAMLRGLMNWVYPDSLHVTTAVWKAQAAGTIPRAATDRIEDLEVEARNRLAFVKTVSQLRKLERALADQQRQQPPPNLAVVLLESMLWSRYEVLGDTVRLTAHVSGPESGDVVVVTESAVIGAVVDGQLSAGDALRLGLIRLYGEASARRLVVDWVASIGT